MSTDNDLRKLPPSREALIYQTKWACYEAGYLWRESADNFDIPDLKSDGGEKSKGDYGPLWESTQISRNEFKTFISSCFCGPQKCKIVNVQKLQWNASLTVYVEENVTNYNLVMLNISNNFWCYLITKLFYFGLFVWILHLKYSIWHAWDFAIVHE